MACFVPIAPQSPVARGRVRTSATEADVVVIGAGIAGLCAAKRIREKKPDASVTILEKSDGVGGRIRSDIVEGYILDRGFQVMIEAYPEQKRALDYDALDLQNFLPGALVYCEGAHYLVSDPVRRMQDTAASLASPVGSLADKIKVGILRTKLAATSEAAIFKRDEVATLQYLKNQGFSPAMIDRFFKPFYQGIFLAPLEEQSSRMFEFLFRMFLLAPASLPREGMGAITAQLAAPMNDDIKLHSTVQKLSFDGSGGGIVELEDSTINAKAVVVAADNPSALSLLGSDKLDQATARGSVCLYFSAPYAPPITKPILFLNGELDKGGIVNNMCFPSVVAESYAPKGKTLVSTTIVGDAVGKSDLELSYLVRKNMREWWGNEYVNQWDFIQAYRIPFSQASQTVPLMAEKPSEIDKGIFVCGDHRSTPTLNGSISSGTVAADAVVKYLSS